MINKSKVSDIIPNTCYYYSIVYLGGIILKKILAICLAITMVLSGCSGKEDLLEKEIKSQAEEIEWLEEEIAELEERISELESENSELTQQIHRTPDSDDDILDQENNETEDDLKDEIEIEDPEDEE